MLKHNFRQLRIWIDAVEISKDVYDLTRNFSNEHKYGIASQLYRSAVSIPSNIAEGTSRKSEKDFLHFLTMSLGSAFELETQLVIAAKCNVVSDFDYPFLIGRAQTLQRQITAFANTLL